MVWEKSFVCALLFSGFVAFVEGQCCIHETLKCMRVLSSLPLVHGMHESSQTLDEDCRLQAMVYRCLEGVIVKCNITEKMPPDQEESKQFLMERCNKKSRLRYRYLKHAPCINRQNVDSCKFYPSTDDTVIVDECDLLLKRRNCIKKRVEKYCGKDATFLLHQLSERFVQYDECVPKATTEAPVDEETKTPSPLVVEKMERLKYSFKENINEESFEDHAKMYESEESEICDSENTCNNAD